MKRRQFLMGAAGAVACLTRLGQTSQRARVPELLASPLPDPARVARLPSAALVVADPQGQRVHVIDVATGRGLATVESFRATHAIQIVPAEKRAFVHGKRTDRGGGALAVFKVGPGSADVELNLDLPDAPLHWQPRPDLSEIAYNTTHDSGLTVVDTKTLKVESFPGAAGHHSLMAFLENDVVISNDLVERGKVRIFDRTQGYVDAETDVGGWPHGLNTCLETGRAYCWCADGVHVIGLRGRERGRHLGIIPQLARGQRCWFAWTPQGGRLTHDVSWSNGDVFLPYLTVVDAKAEKLEKIESGTKQPGTLTVSDDAKWGLASSRNTPEALLFDLAASRYVGAIPIGGADPKRFFDRDLSIAPGGQWAAVSNPRDPGVSVLDLKSREEVARIPLTFSPGWMKLLLT